MFDTWEDTAFRTLYAAVQAAVTRGSQIIEWNAGDTGAKKEAVTLTANYIAAVNAEFRNRWPGEVGRRRITRTRPVFT